VVARTMVVVMVVTVEDDGGRMVVGEFYNNAPVLSWKVQDAHGVYFVSRKVCLVIISQILLQNKTYYVYRNLKWPHNLSIVKIHMPRPIWSWYDTHPMTSLTLNSLGYPCLIKCAKKKTFEIRPSILPLCCLLHMSFHSTLLESSS